MRDRTTVTRRQFGFIGAALVATSTGVPLATRASRATQGTPGASATPSASPQASPSAAATATITMTNDLQFDPRDLVIPARTTVTWENASAMPHTATGDPDQNPVAATNPEYVTLPDGAEPWGSELLQPGDTYSHTFEIPGEYRYICIPHVMSGMRATITVEG